MIEVKLVCGTTNRTLACIASPYLELYVGRDDAPAFCRQSDGLREVVIIYNCNEFELANGPVFIRFRPRIDEVEYAVVSPDSRADLFVYADTLRRLSSIDCSLCRTEEFSVLCWATCMSRERLVYFFLDWDTQRFAGDHDLHKLRSFRHLPIDHGTVR
jgi:hypothetical protein